MNSACIIAACAAASRAAQRSDKKANGNARNNIEIYYKVKLRKYYYFDEMTLVITPYFKPVKVPARTVGIEHVFTVPASRCPNGIDRYIKENLKTFDESSLWKSYDNKVIFKYIDELNEEFRIDLDPSSLTYKSQFYWEVC